MTLCCRMVLSAWGGTCCQILTVNPWLVVLPVWVFTLGSLLPPTTWAHSSALSVRIVDGLRFGERILKVIGSLPRLMARSNREIMGAKSDAACDLHHRNESSSAKKPINRVGASRPAAHRRPAAVAGRPRCRVQYPAIRIPLIANRARVEGRNRTRSLTAGLTAIRRPRATGRRHRWRPNRLRAHPSVSTTRTARPTAPRSSPHSRRRRGTARRAR